MQTSGQLQTRCSEHFPSGARGEAPLFCGLHRVREDDKLSTCSRRRRGGHSIILARGQRSAHRRRPSHRLIFPPIWKEKQGDGTRVWIVGVWRRDGWWWQGLCSSALSAVCYVCVRFRSEPLKGDALMDEELPLPPRQWKCTKRPGGSRGGERPRHSPPSWWLMDLPPAQHQNNHGSFLQVWALGGGCW